jgi:hypothetical protein
MGEIPPSAVLGYPGRVITFQRAHHENPARAEASFRGEGEATEPLLLWIYADRISRPPQVDFCDSPGLDSRPFPSDCTNLVREWQEKMETNKQAWEARNSPYRAS